MNRSELIAVLEKVASRFDDEPGSFDAGRTLRRDEVAAAIRAMKPAPRMPAATAIHFPRFWDAWGSHPRRVAKPQCEAKWIAKGLDAKADQVIAAVLRYKRSPDCLKDNGAFMRAPLVWLNQDCWEAFGPELEEAPSPIKATDDVLEAYKRNLAAVNAPESREKAIERAKELRARMGMR